MFKISIYLLSCLACFTQARPSYSHGGVLLPEYEHIEYAPTVIGHTVHHLPTAVSHQSQTIIHEKRPYLRPIVEHTPIVHHTPLVHNTYSHVPESLGIPAGFSPLQYSGLYDHELSPSYSSHELSPSYGSVYGAGWNGWPLK